jgi:hypothetical protein
MTRYNKIWRDPNTDRSGDHPDGVNGPIPKGVEFDTHVHDERVLLRVSNSEHI